MLARPFVIVAMVLRDRGPTLAVRLAAAARIMAGGGPICERFASGHDHNLPTPLSPYFAFCLPPYLFEVGTQRSTTVL